jgi:hemerythrin
LEEYVQKHFSDEEAMMKRIEYPQLNDHRQIHQQFVEDFLKLKHDFSRNQNSTIIQLQFQCRVCDWVMNHIMGEDRLLGACIRKNGCPSS